MRSWFLLRSGNVWQPENLEPMPSGPLLYTWNSVWSSIPLSERNLFKCDRIGEWKRLSTVWRFFILWIPSWVEQKNIVECILLRINLFFIKFIYWSTDLKARALQQAYVRMGITASPVLISRLRPHVIIFAMKAIIVKLGNKFLAKKDFSVREREWCQKISMTPLTNAQRVLFVTKEARCPIPGSMRMTQTGH